MEFVCKTRGVCSMQIAFDLDENHIVNDIRFVGGCSGNTQGVAALANGKKAEDIIALLEGIDCGGKGTSCPDQLARALRMAMEEE